MNNRNKMQEICLDVEKMLIQCLGVPKELLGQEYWETSLTSAHFGIKGMDMVYLFFEIEKKYAICINNDLLDEHGFDSVMGIARAILAMNPKG